jgi:hypothetical protein
MPRELKDVNVEFISLVNKGANKQNIQIYKSADYKPDSVTPVVKEEDSLLQRIIKSVTEVVKGETKRSFEERMTQSIAQSNIWRAVDVLQSMIYDILYAWPGEEYETETPMADIGKLIDEFKAFYLSNLNALGITKAAQQMKESIDLKKAAEEGLKIQKNAGLTQTHVAQIQKCSDTLQEVLELAKASTNTVIEKEGEKDMDAQALSQVIKSALEPLVKSIEEVNSKVTSLEKSKVDPQEVAKAQEAAAQATEAATQANQTATEAVEKASTATTEVAKTAEQMIADAFKSVGDALTGITKSVDGLAQRVAKMEEAPLAPNTDSTSTTVQKSAGSEFGSLFTFPGENK